jgi:hypothetical protein
LTGASSQALPAIKLTISVCFILLFFIMEARTQCFNTFVFNDDYSLMSLEDLEKHIKLNKHLPGIPSAEEIDNNGLMLGETQKLMMQKIEELTLYIIELKKEINNLKSK